jgi:nitrate reductase gamma subunit
MSEFLYQIFFGYYPYVALSVFLVGSLVRFDHGQYTWRSGSSQLLRKKTLRVGSICFHLGILAIFGGHFVGLLTPKEVYHAVGLSTEVKQLLAMAAGGIFGLVCLLGMTLLIWRRLADPRIRATSSAMDIAILLILYAQLILGLSTIVVSTHHLDGSVMVALAEWAQRIVTLRGGAAELVVPVHWIYKAHILLGLTIVVLFPFSRLVHIWSAPIWYVARPYQVVRRRTAAAR